MLYELLSPMVMMGFVSISWYRIVSERQLVICITHFIYAHLFIYGVDQWAQAIRNVCYGFVDPTLMKSIRKNTGLFTRM